MCYLSHSTCESICTLSICVAAIIMLKLKHTRLKMMKNIANTVYLKISDGLLVIAAALQLYQLLPVGPNKITPPV